MSAASHVAFIERLFRTYDDVTLPRHGLLAAQDKDDGTSVTLADQEASALVVARLNAYMPDAGIICEEEVQSVRPHARRQWAVDPLDGTASYARGLPVWGLGMGLLEDCQPVAGYLRFPALRQTFTFEDGQGRLNAEPICTVGHGVSGDTRNVMITAVHTYIDVRRLAGHRLHNLGSNLYHLLMLACGRCEAIITGPCYLWDLAPALPFTRAAGCVERYLDGSVLELTDLIRPQHGFPVQQPLLIGPPQTVDKLLASLG
jgi:histidinol-phosphatase